MRDEIDGRLWADHHHSFSAGIDQMVADIWQAFRTLNRIQFQAPWRQRSDTPC